MRLLLLSMIALAACGGAGEPDAAPSSAPASAADLVTFCDRLPRPAYARLQLHDASDDWYEVYEVGAGVWAIYEPFQWQEVISYLIAGTEYSVLFDSGNGIGRIRPIVEELTDTPVRVINSHGHFDHIGGNFEFDEVLSVSLPFTLERMHGVQNEMVSMEASPQALCKALPDGVTEDSHRILPFKITGRIADGDILDLGGRRLEVLQVPGHTPDAIALLDREAGYLWTGDSFYEGPIWLFFPETDLPAYRDSVARLAALVPELQAVFPAHNTPHAEPALLLKLEDYLLQILAGEVEAVSVGDGNVEFRFEEFSFLMREDYNRID